MEPGEEIWLKKDQERIRETMLNEAWEKIQQRQGKSIKKRNLIRRVKVAACILILLASGVFIYLISSRQNRQQNLANQASIQNENAQIHPGGNKAILTLANGQQIVLDQAQNGSLAKQGNTRIIKLNNGQLSYNRQSSIVNGQSQAAEGTQSSVLYNTITTPRGGQYEIILPDGSKVWLNAASSIKFPTAFTGKERQVKMEGEAYFEVAQQASKPFVVVTGNAEIKVLGTRFNINAYSNENHLIRATLAEGAIHVASLSGNGEGLGVRLKPGQQAVLSIQTSNINIREVNVDQMLAWKNGLFYFDDTNIKAIMKQVTRWYNVDVIFATQQLKNKNYSGIMSRYSNVEDVLKRMELTGTIHFKVEGKTITVMD
jgi:ferric-dicitrate binding protein FerR (iron transport regulator)